MPTLSRLVASVAIALALSPAVPAQTLSHQAMFQKLSVLAQGGDAEAKYHLGMFLNNGIGTARDNPAAYKFFTEAAAAGHELAAYKVGCYLAGQFPGVVPVNAAEALKFKLRAAEAGYALAQQDVGVMYAKQQDLQNATLWWERASRQGNVPATALLANHLSGDASPDKTPGYALLLLLKELEPNAPQKLLEHIAKVEAPLTADDKARAGTLRAGWLTGKSALSVKADAGMAPVQTLLASR